MKIYIFQYFFKQINIYYVYMISNIPIGSNYSPTGSIYSPTEIKIVKDVNEITKDVSNISLQKY